MSMPSFLQLASLNSLTDRPDKYKKDTNVITQSLFREFIQIMEKPIPSRTSDDFEVLTFILQKFDFLKNIKIDTGLDANQQTRVLYSAAKKIKYEYFSTGTALFHEGVTDDKIYLVLQGNAISYIPGSPDDTVPDKPENQNGCSPGTLEDLDKQQRKLFQPRKGKRFLRNLTTLGSLNTGVDDNKFPSRVFSTMADVDGNSNLPTCVDDSIENEEDFEEDSDREVKPRMKKEYSLLFNFSETLPDKYFKDNAFLFKPVKLLQQGDYFGETALINSKPRTNTVIASSDLHVITLKRQKYNALLSGLSKNLNQNTQFLKDLLPGVTTTQYIKLASLFEECFYSFNNQIFCQGENLDGFYLVREGEVQLCLAFEESKTRLKGHELNVSKEKKKHLIATVTKGESLGEESFFSGVKSKYTAVVSTPKAVLLKMKKSVYETLNGPCKSLFGFLMSTSELKRKIHNEKLNEIIQAAQVSHQEKYQKAKQAQIQKQIISTTTTTQQQVQSPVVQPQTPPKFFFGKPVQPDGYKNEDDANSFRRGYLLQERYLKIAEDYTSKLLQQQKSNNTVTIQEDEAENFLYDLIPPCKEKEIMLFHKKKREKEFKAKMEGKFKKESVFRDDHNHKSYMEHLESAINCINSSNRHTIRPSIHITDNLGGTSEINSSRSGALNQVLSPYVNEKNLLLSDRSEQPPSSLRKGRNLKLVASTTYRLSPGYIATEGSPGIKSPVKVNTTTSLGVGTVKNEVQSTKHSGNITKNKMFSLMDKLGEISVNNNQFEISTADYFGVSPTERSGAPKSVQNKKRVNNSNSPRRAMNIHVESALKDPASQTARMQDNNPFKLDLKRVLISSKHNMFRVKTNKKVLQEKYQSTTTRGLDIKGQ